MIVAAPSLDGYTYATPRPDVSSAHICLTDVNLRHGHVAAWLGVTAPGGGGSWLQAGIEQADGQPTSFAYIETGYAGQMRSLRVLSRAHCATVRVLHVGKGVWRIQIGAITSERIFVPEGQTLLTGEGYGHGTNTYRPVFTDVTMAK